MLQRYVDDESPYPVNDEAYHGKGGPRNGRATQLRQTSPLGLVCVETRVGAV